MRRNVRGPQDAVSVKVTLGEPIDDPTRHPVLVTVAPPKGAADDRTAVDVVVVVGAWCLSSY